MKFAHFSDLHYCPKHLEEVDRCFDAAVGDAIHLGSDCAVISGDLWDHRVDLNTPAVARLLERVRALAEAMPVLILQGTFSHDAPGANDVFKTIGGEFPVHVVDRPCQVFLNLPHRGLPPWDVSSGHRFDGDDLDFGTGVLFSCLPSIHKGRVAATFGPEGAAIAAGEQVAELLASWAPVNQHARVAAIPTIVVSHGTVSGCTTEHGVPMAGLDHEFTTGSLFAAEADAVMLGHIHKHQWWADEGRKIAYPGSIGRLHFGEEDPKGWLLWEISPGDARVDFIHTPARHLVHLDFTGPPDFDQILERAPECDGAHVRVRYVIDSEHRASVDHEHILGMLEHAAAVKIEPRILPVQRTRGSGIAIAETIELKLERWAEVTESDAPPLIERVRRLQSEDPAEITREWA